MNQRIRELKKQATTTRYTGHGEIDELDTELFAKLIVLWCAEIASSVGTNTMPTDFALDKCYEIESKIREYFGVE